MKKRVCILRRINQYKNAGNSTTVTIITIGYNRFYDLTYQQIQKSIKRASPEASPIEPLMCPKTISICYTVFVDQRLRVSPRDIPSFTIPNGVAPDSASGKCP